MRKTQAKHSITILFAVLTMLMMMNFSVFAEPESTEAVPTTTPNQEEALLTVQETSQPTEESNVVKIGDQSYSSFAAAIEAVGAQTVITMTSAVEEDIVIGQGKEIIIDLNGFTLTNKSGHTIQNSGQLEIRDGSEEKTGRVDNVTNGKAALYNTSTGMVTLTSGTFDRSAEQPDATRRNSYYTIQNEGTLTIQKDVVVKQGTTTSSYSSLIENGYNGGDETKSEATLTIEGGTFSGGMATIKNDELGNLVIKDGSFTNATDAVGTSVVLNWHKAKIEGGTFQGNKNCIINGKYNAFSVGDLTITGGTFKTADTTGYKAVGKNSNYPSDEIVITGGSFNTAPDSAWYNGKVLVYNEDGSCTVANEGTTVKIGERFFKNLQAAVNAVQKGETITITADISGNGVKVGSDKAFTLDFQGHTFTIDGATVGSTGTETSGFQLLKNASIEFKNGTIKSDKAKLLIQNYAKLTLRDMKLLGGSVTEYVLSNNCGAVNITGATNITAEGNNFAFDAYYWPSNGYTEGVSVTIDTTGTITGKIERTKDGTATDADFAEKNSIAIKNGTFTTDVSQWVAEGSLYTTDNTGNYQVSPAQIQVNDNPVDGTLTQIVNSAGEGAVITLPAGMIPVAQTIAVNKAVTIKGAGQDATTITRGVQWTPQTTTSGEQASLINIIANDVTLENFTVTGAKKVDNANGHGVNIYDATNVKLNNITSKDNAAAGVVINSSEVYANGLKTSGNGWYGINLDQYKDADGNPVGSVYFEMDNQSEISDGTQIYADHGRNTAYDIQVSLPREFKRYNTGAEAFVWSTGAMDNGIYIEKNGKENYYPSVEAAITAAESGETVHVGTGSFGTGKALTIDKNITIQGNGQDKTTIIDRFVVKGNVKVDFNDLKVDVPNTAVDISKSHLVAIQVGTTDNNSARATVTLNQCAVNLSTGCGPGYWASNVRIESGAAGSTLTINNSVITGKTTAPAENGARMALIRNDSADSTINIVGTTVEGNDLSQFQHGLVTVSKNSTYNIKDSIIKASGVGIGMNTGSTDLATGNKVTIDHSTIESTGSCESAGGGIFYGGVAVDMYQGQYQTMKIINGSKIVASASGGNCRAISYLSSNNSVTTIQDSEISSTGIGIVAQNASDNMALTIENSSVTADTKTGIELSTNTPVLKVVSSTITTKAAESVWHYYNAGAIYLSRGAMATVDKNSVLIAPNRAGVYISSSKDDGYAYGGRAGKASINLDGTIYADEGIVQSQYCGIGGTSDGPISITLGANARVFALKTGLAFNSTHTTSGAAEVTVKDGAQIFAPTLVTKGEDAVTDITPLKAAKFYAVDNVFTYADGKVALKEATIENKSDGQKYLSIQQAIDHAYANDEIVIPAGTYSENITLTKAIKLTGAQAGISANDAEKRTGGETVLKGSITFDSTKTIRNTTIDGFTFTGNSYIQAVYWDGSSLVKPKLSNVVIKNNIFENLDTVNGGGNTAAIHLNCDSSQAVNNITVENNRFSGITSTAEGKETAAFFVNAFTGNLLVNDNVVDGTTGNAYTISGGNSTASKVDITGNTLTDWKNRAIRLDQIAGSIQITENAMIPGESDKNTEDVPQIIKVTESSPVEASLNYWGAETPVFKKDGKNNSVISGEINPYPYYSNAEMTSVKEAPAIVYEGTTDTVRGMYGDLQEAVNGAMAGDTIKLNAEAYVLTAPITIDKALTIQGNLESGVWIKSQQNKDAFTVTQDITGDLIFDGVNITTQAAPTDNESPKGINVSEKAVTGNLIYKNATIKDMYFGILVAVNRSDLKDKKVGTLTIENANFINNLHKAVYVENADKIAISQTTFAGGASTGTAYWPTRVAVDINEKYNTYDSVTIKGCTFTNIQGTPGTPSQEGQSGYGAALAVKARNDGNYADPAAALENVTITGNTFTGNTCDLMLGEPKSDGSVDSKTYNLGTLKVEGNAFSAKVQNNYSDLMDIPKNYWGSTTPEFAALTAGNLNVYQYYTDSTMKTLYAPIELNHADGITYYGDIAKAYEAAEAGDTISVNKSAEPGMDTVTLNDVDMNAKAVNLKLNGNTTFTGTFSGSTLVDLILSNGITADFTGATVSNIAKVAVDGFNAADPTQIQAASTVKQYAFITESGTLNFASDDVNTWTFVNPSDQFNGGDGKTAETAYQINTPEQLVLLKKMQEQGDPTANKYFKLTTDIEVTSWTALSDFAGNLDGNGHTITYSGNAEAPSFIGTLTSAGKVEKLRFEGFANLINASEGKVENCYTLSGNGAVIVGTMDGTDSAVKNSFTTGAVAVTTKNGGGVTKVFYCGENSTSSIGTAMTTAEMQKARFAITLNGGTTGVWNYSAAATASAYPFVDGAEATIKPITVNLESADTTGKILTVSSIGSEPFYANDVIELNAKVENSDYLFSGWYQNGILISDYPQYTYTLKSEGKISIIANYKAKPTIQFSVMNGSILAYGDGNGTVAINDGSQSAVSSNGKATIGSSVTIKAEANSDSQFSYWRTMFDAKPISYNANYTFNASTQETNMVFVAVFDKKAEDVFDVTFMNQGVLYAKQKVNKNETVTPITNPTYIGKSFVEWVDEKGEAFNLTTPITRDTVLTAKYKDAIPTYTVTVEGGTINPEKDSYNLNERVTITASDATQGEHFAGWVKEYSGDSSSSVVSYDVVYSFAVAENVTFVATYSPDVVEEKPLASINQSATQTKTLDAGENSLFTVKFIGGVKIPANYTGVSTGLIYLVSDVDETLNIPANLDTDFIIGATGVVTGSKMSMAPYDGMQFTKGKGSLKAGQTVASRVYLTCLNSQGEEVTFYSDVAQWTVTAQAE